MDVRSVIPYPSFVARALALRLQPSPRLLGPPPRPLEYIPYLLFVPLQGTGIAVPHETPQIVLVAGRLDAHVLAELVRRHFEDMVKYVVDVERSVAAVGGELHADEEAVLLEDGSRQDDLWGANYYPGRGPDDCIEYTSLINIRPSAGNRSMVVQDEALRARIRAITHALIGRGEPLP